MQESPHQPRSTQEFERQAQRRSEGAVRSLLGFMRANNKWWLLPILASLLVLWILVMAGGSSLAPFIYALW